MLTGVPFELLVTLLQRGDTDAARHVFECYARRLVGLAALRLPSTVQTKEDPEDVVQSVFRTFFRRMSAQGFELNGWDALWGLLAAITVNKCGHRVQRFLGQRRDVRRELGLSRRPDPHAGAPGADGWQLADPAPTPAEALLLQETLQEVLECLTTRQRPVVLLRLQGYAIAEIAIQLRCTERTVFRHLEVVRTHLTSRIEKD